MRARKKKKKTHRGVIIRVNGAVNREEQEQYKRKEFCVCVCEQSGGVGRWKHPPAGGDVGKKRGERDYDDDDDDGGG